MPGYVIHLAEAKLIAETLFSEKDKIRLKAWPETKKKRWTEAFYCGALLPDAVEKKEKEKSHFWGNADQGCIFRTPDLSLFRSQKTLHLSDPVLCGYYVHLQLDRLFFSEYLPRFIEIQDENGQQEQRQACASSVYLKKQQKAISISDFFSERYLYGDYTKLNFALVEHYQLALLDSAVIPSGECCGIDLCNLNFIQKDLDQYLKSSEQSKGGLQIFSLHSLMEYLECTARLAAEELLSTDVLQSRKREE